MKNFYIIAASSILLAASVSWVSAFDSIACDSDPAFAQNSCNQCFDGGEKSQGDTVGLLSDDWKNDSTNSQIVYKEDQKLPFMQDISSGSASWSQVPDSESFWEYSDEFNALYDSKQEGYVLPAGQKVMWMKSKLGYGYTLDKNTLSKGGNIGLLVYPFKPHNILESGEITIDDVEHRECVLFKSAGAPSTPETPSTPSTPEKPQLPKTGPESIVFVAIALLLAFGLLMFTRKNAN